MIGEPNYNPSQIHFKRMKDSDYHLKSAGDLAGSLSKINERTVKKSLDISIKTLSLNKLACTRETTLDLTYYHTNQRSGTTVEDFKRIQHSLDSESNAAIFIGDGNIFKLLPSLQYHAKTIVLVDYDPKFIDFKKYEIDAYLSSDNVTHFQDKIKQYEFEKLFLPQYLLVNTNSTETKEELFELFKYVSGLGPLRIPKPSVEEFKEIKEALSSVKMVLIPLDVLNTEEVKELSSALEGSNLKVSVFNRSNLLEYTTPQAQAIIFKKYRPELSQEKLLSNLSCLPFSEKLITFFGVSLGNDNRRDMSEERAPSTTHLIQDNWANSVVYEQQLINRYWACND